ncbi:uncharacterized protein LOC129591880 [Paramacrobiotus metropolitanus]|uniref:uncharacterized protein LOC129591880 n=1 Tax=Paramacrobiotus metropolitanus TaxID=2943436 RepID=UPI002445AFA1|nr:uncharacterized protein LOC129591880 [Paramacrobiotus metropolitanus]
MHMINHLPTGFLCFALFRYCCGASLKSDLDDSLTVDYAGENVVEQPRVEKRLFHYPVYSSPNTANIRKPCILPSGQILAPDKPASDNESTQEELAQNSFGNGEQNKDQRDVYAVLSTRFQTLNGLNRLRLRPVRDFMDPEVKVYPRTYYVRNARAAKTAFPLPLRALRSLRRCIRGA